MKKEIYHMSEADDLVRLEPSIPTNPLTNDGYEDSKTPRVCFASSIADCLIGLDRDCTGKTYYVYTPDGDYNIYKPTVKECPQSAVTGELWIKEPVNVKLVAKIDNITPTYKELRYKCGNKENTLHKWEHYDCHMIGDVNPIKQEAMNFALPDDDLIYDDIDSLLNSVNPSRIFLTSDWHIFKNHYKTEKNYVKINDIIKWCKNNIKYNDVFMYLGDISYRYADKTDQQRSAEIMASIPGHKILVIGNHDEFLDEEYYAKCGFEFATEQIVWKEYVFTHRPINMSMYPANYINIHGHIHNITKYNTTDGSKNVNVYPFYYDNKPVTLKYIIDNFDKLIEKNHWNPNSGYGENNIFIDPNNKLSVLRNYIFNETKRSELPDSAFGIPEDRKFPLDTEQHVKSAIKLFGHAEESKKKSLAKRIRTAAKKYDLSIPTTTQVYKYLNESVSDLLPDGVNTIILDFGGVLVDFDIHNTITTGLAVSDLLAHEIADFVEEFFAKTNDEPLVNCSIDKAKHIFAEMAPDYIASYVDKIFELIPHFMYICGYTYEFLSTLRSKGYFIYYLSNWPKFVYEMQRHIFDPLIAKFDGGMFDFEAGYSKPDVRIYEELIAKYGLDPDKCVFIDDRAENVISANNAGIHGILFDKDVIKVLMDNNFSIPSNINNTILIGTGVQLESMNVDDIGSWYCCYSRNPSNINEDMYSNTAQEAINTYCTNIAFKDDEPIEANMFINNGAGQPIPAGKVSINSDMTYEWLIQYPIEYDGDVFTSCICEWSMAAFNPVQGINKPFILKVGQEYNNSVINTKQYAFSPDIISDKYLVVNENAQLEIINADQLDGCVTEVYEFIGDKTYLKRLNEFYKSGKIVDNTVFYTTLTGKPMLSEDQIDFDPNFKKVNFDEMTESIITEMATIKDKYLESIGLGAFWTPVVESVYSEKIPFLNKYNKHGDISVREDYDGFYFYSTLTKKRSGSVGTSSMLTEAMIKSIL